MFSLASSNQKILPWKNKALEIFIRGREGASSLMPKECWHKELAVPSYNNTACSGSTVTGTRNHRGH